MALVDNAPPPLGDPVAQQPRPGYKPGEDPQAGLVSQAWGDWFTHWVNIQEKSARLIASVELTGLNASIAQTELISAAKMTSGLYELRWGARVTTPDGGLGSSVELVLDWSDHGQALSHTVTVLSADLVTEVGTGSLPLIYCDALAPVEYTVNIAGSIVYQFFLLMYELKA